MPGGWRLCCPSTQYGVRWHSLDSGDWNEIILYKILLIFLYNLPMSSVGLVSYTLLAYMCM
jgi:hypothetical protein